MDWIALSLGSLFVMLFIQSTWNNVNVTNAFYLLTHSQLTTYIFTYLHVYLCRNSKKKDLQRQRHRSHFVYLYQPEPALTWEWVRRRREEKKQERSSCCCWRRSTTKKRRMYELTSLHSISTANTFLSTTTTAVAAAAALAPTTTVPTDGLV